MKRIFLSIAIALSIYVFYNYSQTQPTNPSTHDQTNLVENNENAVIPQQAELIENTEEKQITHQQDAVNPPSNSFINNSHSEQNIVTPQDSQQDNREVFSEATDHRSEPAQNQENQIPPSPQENPSQNQNMSPENSEVFTQVPDPRFSQQPNQEEQIPNNSDQQNNQALSPEILPSPPPPQPWPQDYIPNSTQDRIMLENMNNNQ